MKPLVSLSDSALFGKLKQERPDLGSSLENCWAAAQKLLRHAPATQPEYTSHGPDHALALLRILDEMLTPLALTLPPTECFVLLAATLLHDIGMVGPVAATPAERATMRKTHNLRSRSYINQHWSDLGLDRTLANHIADVAAAHRELNIAEHITDPLWVDERLRLRLLASLLRFADECHITDDRVPDDLAALDLPHESLQHFVAHYNTCGRRFESGSGTVIFSMKVISEDMDRFLKALREKIQEELDALRPTLQLSEVPYKTVVFELDRRDVVTDRVFDYLLHEGPAAREKIAEGIGEEAAPVSACLAFTAEHIAPCPETQAYCLNNTEGTFRYLAGRYLSSTKPFVLVRSDYAQAVLSDAFLESLVGKAMGSVEPREALFMMIRSSPRCLDFALNRAASLRPKALLGSTSLWGHLLAELQDDLREHPSLLLEPDLIDTVFANGDREYKAWVAWKIRQIREYHKAFPDEAVLEQWILPNHWERQQDGKDAGRGTSVSITFTMPKEPDLVSPADLMAAAHRLGLPLELEASASSRITAELPLEVTEGAGKEQAVASFVMSPSKADQVLDIGCPAAIRCDPNGVVFVPQMAQTPSDRDWSLPASIKFRGTPGPQSSAGRAVTITVQLDITAMTCAQMAAIISAADGCADCSVEIAGGTSTVKQMPTSSLASFRSIVPRDESAIAERLARISDYLGLEIPFPFFGVPPEVAELLSKEEVLSPRAAEVAWERVTELMKTADKPFVSTMHVEIRGKEIVHRSLLELVPIKRFPHMKFTTAQPGEAATLDSAIADPTIQVQLPFFIKLSPWAALACMREQPAQIGDTMCTNPAVLGKVKVESAFESRSHVEYDWQPMQESMWYKVCPFVCRLVAVPLYERWLMEALELGEKKDFRRAYIAAAEAAKLAPDKADVLGTLGWAAFRVKKIEAAIEHTRRAHKLAPTEQKVIAALNIGLFNLARANQVAGAEGLIREACSWYADACEAAAVSALANGVENSYPGIEGGIHDLQEYEPSLPSVAKSILSILLDSDSRKPERLRALHQ